MTVTPSAVICAFVAPHPAGATIGAMRNLVSPSLSSSSVIPQTVTASSAAASTALVVAAVHAPAVVRVVDVDVDLIVDCLRPRGVDQAVTLVGIGVGTAVVFPVLDWAAAGAPIATAAALVAVSAAITALLARAERHARLGLGAALIARGVAVDVATVFARAERAAPLRQHLMGTRARAALLRATALRIAEEDAPKSQ